MAARVDTDGEKLIVCIHDHWIKFVVPVLIYLLLTAASMLIFWLAGVSAHHYVWLTNVAYIAALLLFLMAHHWFFAALLSESNEHIVVTTKRVIHMQTRLFFYEDMNEFAFEKMKTVEARKEGLLQNVLRYGSLVFEKSFVVHLVPHPNRVVRDIEQAMGQK